MIVPYVVFESSLSNKAVGLVDVCRIRVEVKLSKKSYLGYMLWATLHFQKYTDILFVCTFGFG